MCWHPLHNIKLGPYGAALDIIMSEWQLGFSICRWSGRSYAPMHQRPHMFSIFHVNIRSSNNNNEHLVLKSWRHKITKARAQTAMRTVEKCTACSKNPFTTGFCSTAYAVVKRQRKSSLSIITGWQILMNSSVETSIVPIFNKKATRELKCQ